MSTEHHLAALASLRARVAAALAQAGETEAAARFVACFDRLPPACGYKYVPPEAERIHNALRTRDGAAVAHQFLYCCILTALRSSLDSPRLQRLPPRVLAHQLLQYERIVSDPQPTIDAAQLVNDLFLKDFGLAALRLYAGGSNLIDHNAGLGRSLLWKNGVADIPRRLWIVARIGGFRPFFEIHAHKFYMAEFNEEGRNECYRCCAELYALHPEVRGMIAGSWFYDPAITSVSPRLAYLRAVPEAGGAYVLFDSYDEGAARNALATSPTRRALHAAGKYRPAAYTIIWPRTRQLAWALQQQAAPATVSPMRL